MTIVLFDRSRYRRVEAPIYVRPVRPRAYRLARNVDDSTVGGLRAYSDDKRKPGTRLEVEIFFPDRSSAIFLVEVSWVEALPDGSPARFDVGLRYVRVSPEDLDRIAQVLGGPRDASRKLSRAVE